MRFNVPVGIASSVFGISPSNARSRSTVDESQQATAQCERHSRRRIPGVSARLLRGEVTPIGGWISRRFAHKEPTATVVFVNDIEGHTFLRTRLILDPPLSGVHRS